MFSGVSGVLTPVDMSDTASYKNTNSLFLEHSF